MLSRDLVEDDNQAQDDMVGVVYASGVKEQSNFAVVVDIASSSIQIALGYICLDLVFAITIHFISQAYTNPIVGNGVGFAFIVCITFIQPFGLGINQQLNLYVAQALATNNLDLAVQKLNIALYIHTIYFLPLGLAIYFFKNLFAYIILEDREETIDYAWDYIIYLIIATYFAIQFECFKAYCIAHNIIYPFIVIHFTTTALLAVLLHILLNVVGLGITGAGYAIIFTEALNCGLLAIYITHSTYKELFTGFTFSFILIVEKIQFYHFVMSSIHMVMHIYAEFLVFVVLMYVAAQLGTISLYAYIAISNTNALFFRICISLSIALITFVGKSTEMGNVKEAKRYSVVGTIVFMIYVTFYIVPLWIFRQEWANFYAVDKAEVQDLMITTLPYFILGYIALDGFQTSLTGILKGLNQAPLVNIFTLIVLYVVGIPIICYFTFQWGLGLGLVGLWVGFGICNGLLMVLYLLAIFFLVKWDQKPMVSASSESKPIMESKQEPYGVMENIDQ